VYEHRSGRVTRVLSRLLVIRRREARRIGSTWQALRRRRSSSRRSGPVRSVSRPRPPSSSSRSSRPCRREGAGFFCLVRDLEPRAAPTRGRTAGSRIGSFLWHDVFRPQCASLSASRSSRWCGLSSVVLLRRATFPPMVVERAAPSAFAAPVCPASARMAARPTSFAVAFSACLGRPGERSPLRFLVRDLCSAVRPEPGGGFLRAARLAALSLSVFSRSLGVNRRNAGPRCNGSKPGPILSRSRWAVLLNPLVDHRRGSPRPDDRGR